ncbi:MAG TPA: alkaline phosphatase family protein [Longilinea sp.]|nr:alkaline phosphatase family protein [Longilinea sp.]
MPDHVNSLLPGLQSNHINDLDTGSGTLHPFYPGRSLVNLPASVCHWLGVPSFGAEPLSPALLSELGGPYKQVVLFLVDGLGLRFLQRFLPGGELATEAPLWGNLLEDAHLFPLTSVVPSTTSAALTSLWTGATPASHGVVGYEVWLKEYGLVANMIFHSVSSFRGDMGGLQRAGFRPDTFLPTPVLGSHLKQHGIRTLALQHESITHSGLSTMLLKDVDCLSYQTLSDLWVTLAQLLEDRSNQRGYTWIYWGDLDDLEHSFGYSDERVALEWINFTVQFGHFLDHLHRQSRGDTLFLMIADHGQVETPPLPEFDLRQYPKLTADLALMPTGESRLSFLHVHPGREQAVQDYVEATWPGKFRLFPSLQVIQAGLLGNGSVHPDLADRVGDWVAVAQGDAYWWWVNKENHMHGRHGGLMEEEMLIPLLAVRI